MIYFTSDLHFGHSSIMKFHPCFRPFSSVEAMDRALIRLWNDRVNPCDTVYNIGDLSFHKDMQTNISIFSKLNGKHVLVLGNHDEAIKKHKDELLVIKKQDGNALFEEICEYKEITVQHGQDKFRLVLFRYPLSEWNAGHHGSIHLYGHIHANIANIKGKALNASYDLHGKILSFEEIYDFVKDLPPFEYSKHRMFSEEDSVESRNARIKEVLERLIFDPS